ncbi:MAG: FlgT C-terminal domain-containing protein [Planctomycetota bacterium]|nr:FlgT C-terminal domain-containing protein [Planctomycetota bacterium]
MAMRSNGGNGVLIALIIFIFLTVGSATAAILLYGQRNTSNERLAQEQQLRMELIRESEANRGDISQLKNEARDNRKSLVGFLVERSNDYRTFVTGDPASDISMTRQRFNLDENVSMADAYNALLQENRLLNGKVQAAEQRLMDAQASLDRMGSDFQALRSSSDDRVNSVMGDISKYAQAAEEYRANMSKTQDDYLRAIDDNNTRHKQEVNALEEEIASLTGDQSVLQSRVNELRKVVDSIRVRPRNPAELVDGRVVDVLGSSDQVFINLGRADRIRPGMTFRVYDDAGKIRVDQRTGKYSEGKASIQVIKVAENTATARVTNGSTARPVVRGDVIANAVFNPEHRFKFLVYGQFDVDGNGNPTHNEADYIRSRIIEWGGEVVEGDQLTGDLDFLVLGDVPEYVFTELISKNATEQEINAMVKKREAYERYEELFQQAINAQIPVLNWNRFRLLTGDEDS